MSARTEATVGSVLGKDSIRINYDIWGSYIASDLLTNVNALTYVLVTDTNLYNVYVPRFEQCFHATAKELGIEAYLHVYQIAPGETSKSRETKAAIESWMLSSERDPPCDTSSASRPRRSREASE